MQPGDEDPDEAGTIVKSKESNITNNRGDDDEGGLRADPGEAVNLNPSKSNREASSPAREGERTST
ncbi:MAG: hypothetical protein U0837_04310 [Dehalococcoidia bacterium]